MNLHLSLVLFENTRIKKEEVNPEYETREARPGFTIYAKAKQLLNRHRSVIDLHIEKINGGLEALWSNFEILTFQLKRLKKYFYLAVRTANPI